MKKNCPALLIATIALAFAGCIQCHTPVPDSSNNPTPLFSLPAADTTTSISGKVTTTPNLPYTLRIPLQELPYPPENITSASITGSNFYELTIYPGDGVVLRPDDAYSHPNTPDSPISRLAEPATTRNHLLLEFTSGLGGTITWKITFSPTPTE